MDSKLSKESPIREKDVNGKRRPPASSLYFSCNYCDGADVSVPKIKNFVESSHSTEDVRTTEHNPPSFRKVCSFKSKGSETCSSGTHLHVQCALCLLFKVIYNKKLDYWSFEPHFSLKIS